MLSYTNKSIMKKTSIATLVILLLIFSCKRTIKPSVNKPIKTTKDTLVVDNEEILIVYPSEKEISILKKKLGEDNFYLTADGENGYISNIYERLNNQDIKYKVFDKQVVFFLKEKLFFNKEKINNPWGIIVFKNGKYKFYSTIEYLSIIEKQNGKIPTDNNKIHENNLQTLDINGSWKIACIEGKSALLIFDKSRGYLDIRINNDYARVSVGIKEYNNTYNLKYKVLTGITRHNEFVDWLDISHDSIIGSFIIKDMNIKFNWLGFYNTKTRKRELNQNIFEKNFEKKLMLLEKCE